jgi:hypothetical protein
MSLYISGAISTQHFSEMANIQDLGKLAHLAFCGVALDSAVSQDK